VRTVKRQPGKDGVCLSVKKKVTSCQQEKYTVGDVQEGKVLLVQSTLSKYNTSTSGTST